MIKLLKKHCMLLGLTFALPLAAEEIPEQKESHWYSVEYIVFETALDDGTEKEPWTKAPLQLTTDNIVSLENTTTEQRVNPLKSNQLQLHGAYNQLNRLTSYRPLKHRGWIQELTENDSLRPVQIQTSNGDMILDGTITFRRARFLHLDINLQLKETHFLGTEQPFLVDTNVEPIASEKIFRLQQTRRIKTGDLHYFDHPRFGVVVKVEKIDNPNTEAISTDVTSNTSSETRSN